MGLFRKIKEVSLSEFMERKEKFLGLMDLDSEPYKKEIEELDEEIKRMINQRYSPVKIIEEYRRMQQLYLDSSSRCAEGVLFMQELLTDWNKKGITENKNLTELSDTLKEKEMFYQRKANAIKRKSDRFWSSQLAN